jgi:energy-coupling factor transporter ATP-binding protein EcfA2
MGVAVLVLGQSGSGKSTALRNFEPNEIGIINVASKPLPFRKKMNVFDTSDYNTIYKIIEGSKLNAYAIDDAGYLMQFENLSRVKENGYNKFTEMAVHFANLFTLIRKAPDDVIVYILAHTQTNDDYTKSIKTIGRMLDEKICVEGLVTICIMAEQTDEGHVFYVNDYLGTPAKSPLEMFDKNMIENDLKAVDTTIRQYYGLKAIDKVERG